MKSTWIAGGLVRGDAGDCTPLELCLHVGVGGIACTRFSLGVASYKAVIAKGEFTMSFARNGAPTVVGRCRLWDLCSKKAPNPFPRVNQQ
jgi:hypothetical protein